MQAMGVCPENTRLARRKRGMKKRGQAPFISTSDTGSALEDQEQRTLITRATLWCQAQVFHCGLG